MPIKLILSDSREIKTLKEYLEQNSILLKKHKIEKHDNQFHIYTTLSEITNDLSKYTHETYQEETPQIMTLYSIVNEFCVSRNIESPPESTIPKRWSIYPPMILFNSNTFDGEPWQQRFQQTETLSHDLFEHILSHQQPLFGTSDITHLAINKPIIDTDNIMRKPLNVLPLHGDFGPLVDSPAPTQQDFQQAFWCHVVQNGIYQTWAPSYTMFSRGNIKEKKRVLDNWKNLNGSVIFDFYCGIGYFSLSYLKNGGKLMCWELNPWSIEGFRRSLEYAGYKYKIIHSEEDFEYEKDFVNSDIDAYLFLESNENIPNRLKSFPEKSLPISHINLGLLPTSKAAWGIAHQLIKEKSNRDTIVRIHENVHIDDFDKIKQEAGDKFASGEVTHLEKVKTFAPDVWHLVIDLKQSVI